MQLAFNADVTDDPDAEELHAAAVPLLERAGRRRDVAILQLNRGVTHMVRGRWPAALAMFELAADGFRRCGFVLGSLSTDANRGGLLLEQGHPVAAAELFDDVVRRAYAAGNTRKALWARASGHRARAWAGQTDGAIEGLVECIQAHRDAGLAVRGRRAQRLPRRGARARRALRGGERGGGGAVAPPGRLGRPRSWSSPRGGSPPSPSTSWVIPGRSTSCERCSTRRGPTSAGSRSPAASRPSSCAPRRSTRDGRTSARNGAASWA